MGQQRKKINIVFFYIYGLFGIILVYLLFFNLGLEIVQEELPNETRFFVANNSLHLIHDINVLDSTGKSIQFTPLLLPNEKERISLTGISSKRLTATAPFHSSVSVELTGAAASPISSNTGKPVLSYTTSYPSPVFVNKSFSVNVSLCNAGADLNDGFLTPTFSADYFFTQDPQKPIVLKAGACNEFDFEFTPLNEGASRIVFKLEYLNNSQEIPIDFEIQK